MNKYLKRQNHPEAGEVFVRVVASSDKTVEVKPGMKSRWVFQYCPKLAAARAGPSQHALSARLYCWMCEECLVYCERGTEMQC